MASRFTLNFTSNSRARTIRVFIELILLAGATALIWSFSLSACDRLPYVVVFAGDADRFSSGLQAAGCTHVTFDEARWIQSVAIVVSLAWAGTVYDGLAHFWPRGWRSAPFNRWKNIERIPLWGGALLALAQIGGFFALRDNHGKADLYQPPTQLLPTLGWTGAMLLLVSTVLLVFAIAGTYGSRNSPYPRDLETVETATHPNIGGLGIALSGGGIRAGSVALGALWKLEQTSADDLGSLTAKRRTYLADRRKVLENQGLAPSEIARELANDETNWIATHDSVLERSKYLASVSGGGYTAGAYRIARGVKGAGKPDPAIWESGSIFGPEGDVYSDQTRSSFDDPSEVVLPYNLRRHILSRRRYLLTGRGGLVGSSLLVVLGLVIQAILIVLLVSAVAWPLGRLASSWAITEEDSYTLAARHWIPIALLALTTAGLLGTTLRRWRTSARLSRERVSTVAAAGTIATAAVTVGLPVVIGEFSTARLGAALIASATLLGGTVSTLASRVLSASIAPRLTRLGGVLLGLVAALLALFVASEAGRDGGLFNGDGWRWVYAGLLCLLAALWWSLDPRWWSLHVIYRHRLRDAFAVTSVRDLGRSNHPWAAKFNENSPALLPISSQREPQLHEYVDAPGPEPLFCASAARTTTTSTGITALSFVISPRNITFYDINRPAEETQVFEYSAPTTDYLNYLGPKQPPNARQPSRPARRRQALGTVSTAMSLSGAAISSSMGRSDLGTTNALLAALNLRLGTWLPNPRYVTQQQHKPGSAPATRLNYLLKEIVGGYDIDEPYLYVTDGGHRENLGLVELLRRRCETIICVDASGDPPGSFSTLMQAARLARTEVGAVLKFTGHDGKNLLDELRSDGKFDGPRTCGVKIPIHYDESEEPTGFVLYTKAIVDDTDPLLMSFKEEDPDFPNYSTGNQFLKEDQVRMLIKLGFNMADAAIQAGTRSPQRGGGNEILVALRKQTSANPASPAPEAPT